jgi:hypothetical protein
VRREKSKREKKRKEKERKAKCLYKAVEKVVWTKFGSEVTQMCFKSDLTTE